MDNAEGQRKAGKALDAYLVAAARLGDRKALAHLAARWHPRLVAHAWRLLGDKELARDAAQSAWGDIQRSLRSLREERAFAAWAYRIVSRSCAREIGKKTHDRELKSAIAAEPQETATLPAEPSQRSRLKTAIRQLPAGERAAIALYHFEEMRVAEVAVALDIPAGTVKTRLMHARRKLRAILDPDIHKENIHD